MYTNGGDDAAHVYFMWVDIVRELKMSTVDGCFEEKKYSWNGYDLQLIRGMT